MLRLMKKTFVCSVLKNMALKASIMTGFDVLAVNCELMKAGIQKTWIIFNVCHAYLNVDVRGKIVYQYTVLSTLRGNTKRFQLFV